MFSLVIAHILITACCLWSGCLFYTFLSGKNEQRPIIFHAISGLILLTVFTQVIILFFPVNPNAQLAFAIVLLLSVLFKWNDFKNYFKRILSELASLRALPLTLFFFTWLAILLINAGPTIMDDTESYHIQSIKWIQEYGTVPGLVNLHERFGFNSSWFSSVSLFSFFPDTTGGFTVLNSVISMWFCYWLISKYNFLQKENKPQAAFALLIIFISSVLIWPLIRGNAATTNYDFITTIAVFILFTEIFLSHNKEISPSIEWIVWPAYLLTVRIINFPVLLLSLAAIIFFIKQKKVKTLLLLLVYCLLLIVPFLARNVIITGYPFYPATYFNWFSADWKPDPQQIEKLLEYIKYYNRVPTTYLEIEQTKALGSNWIPSWFRYLFLYDKLLTIAGIAGLLITSILLLIRKHFYNRKTVLAIVVCGLSICCWFVISPDPRFIYGILLSGVFLLAYNLIVFIKNSVAIKFISNIAVILLIAGTGYYLFSKPFKQKEFRNLFQPAQLPQPPIKEIVIDGITFHIPEPIYNNWNARCYGTDLPCLYKIDPRLKPRGKSISNGFRLEK